MAKPLTDLAFAQWLAFIFDRPVSDPPWYRDDNADWWDGPPECTAEYLALLFENADELLRPYSDAQVGQGLRYIASNDLENDMYALIDEQVAWPLRRRAIGAMYELFARCFAVRCSPLQHGNQTASDLIDGVCYMWFDIITIHGRPEEPARAGVDQAMLDVLERILTLESEACQESALHGLGHWFYDPHRVESIIDAYLRRNPQISEPLRAYAAQARAGAVL